MGDVAAVATTLRRIRSKQDERSALSLSKVWTDFWLLRSFDFRGVQLESQPASVGSSQKASSDVADLTHCRRFPDGFKRDGDSLPEADGQRAEDSDFIPSNTPLSRSLSVNSTRQPHESGMAASTFSLPKAADYPGVPRLSDPAENDDQKSAYQNLLSGLRERYQSILRRRMHYVNLLSFVFFTAFYSAILYHQRRAFLGYDIHKSLTYLLPRNDNGDVVSELRSMVAVHDWLETLVNETWIDPICGNNVCEIPVEGLAYGRFGCQEDCGWRKELLQVTISLSYTFATDEIRTSSLWNICRVGLCSRAAVDPKSSSPPQSQFCYFPIAGTFAHPEGSIDAAIYLPLSEQWEFCLVTPSPVVSVAGTITQVSMAAGERTCRSAQRTGYLWDGPVDRSVEELFAGASMQAGVTGVQLGGQRDDTAGATSNSTPNAATYASTNAVTNVSIVTNANSTTDATMVSTTNVTANATSSCAADSSADPKKAVLLETWTYSRALTPCGTDCLAMTACMFRCQDYRDEADAMLGVVLPDFNVAGLAELCAEQAGCAAHPERRLPKAALECTNFGPFLDLLLRGESLVDATGDATNGTGNGMQGSGVSYVPGMNATGVALLAGLISTCHAKLVEQQSAPLQQVPKCSPGCSYLNMGDFKCDFGCLTEECQYDFADCCEEHRHYGGVPGSHHFHCPSNELTPLQTGDRLFRVGFTVPSQMDANATLDAGSSVAIESQFRMAGVTNRIIAGILIWQYRTQLQRAPPTKKFSSLYDTEFGMDARAKPFGANPRFLSESSFFVPQLVNRTHEFFTPDQLSDQDVPRGFFPLRHRGRDVFPVFIDMSKTQDEALMWVKYLEAGSFLDVASEEVDVQIITYNGILEYFGLLVVSFRRQPGGVVSITSTVQMFSLDMYNTPAERLRGVGEVLLALMVIAGTWSELQEVVACILETGTPYSYFADVVNLMDLTSISLFYVSIALWIYFLVRYHGRFDIKLSYQPYQTLFDDDGEKLAKMLELVDDGDVMRELLERFEEVHDIARAVNMYSFLTALNLLFVLFRIIKLTDFHPRLGIITHTLARATNDIAHYLLVAGLVFVNFGTMAHLSFGTILEEFSTLSDAFNTCFLMVVGEAGINDKLIKMHGLQLAMAWLFFWLFMIVMNLILINFFIAFIIDSFTDHMSSGARSSSTVAHDLSDIFRDAARQAWARLTCQGGRTRSDASMAAKLEALATLTAGTEPTHNEKEVEEGGRGIDLSDKGQYIRFLFDLDEDPSNGGGGTRVGVRSIKQPPQRQQARSGALEDKAGRADLSMLTIREGHADVDRDDECLHPAKNGVEVGHGGEGKGGSGVEHMGRSTIREGNGSSDDDGWRAASKVAEGGHVGGLKGGVTVDAGLSYSTVRGSPTSTDKHGSIMSRLWSLLLPATGRARAQAQRRQQRSEETQRVAINGYSFTEDEVAKLLLDGMHAANLAGGRGGPGGKGNGGNGAVGFHWGSDDAVVPREQALARTVLFGRSHSPGGCLGIFTNQAPKGTEDKGGAEGRVSRAGLTPVVETSFASRCGRLCGQRSGGDGGIDLESSLDCKDAGGSKDKCGGDPVGGAGTLAACHVTAREISSHAIWRFGTMPADGQPANASAMAGAGKGAGKGVSDSTGKPLLGPMAAGEPSMPDDPTVQIAHMVGGLQAQLVEMEARWTSSMAAMEARWTSSLDGMEARWTALLSQLVQAGGSVSSSLQTGGGEGQQPGSSSIPGIVPRIGPFGAHLPGYGADAGRGGLRNGATPFDHATLTGHGPVNN